MFSSLNRSFPDSEPCFSVRNSAHRHTVQGRAEVTSAKRLRAPGPSGFPWFSGEVNLFVLSGQRNQHFWNMFNKTKNSVCFDWLIGGGIVLVS
mgnify:CR=1 FL=1